MGLLVIVVVLLLIFGGGGYYGGFHGSYPQAYWGGSGLLALVVLVCVFLLLTGRL